MAAGVEAAFHVMRDAAVALAHVRQAAADREAARSSWRFRSAELDRAALTPGEDEQLSATRQVLASAERVERLVS